MDPDERPRFYGTDSTEEFETLAEGTLLDDGRLYFDIVQLDKRDDSDPR